MLNNELSAHKLLCWWRKAPDIRDIYKESEWDKEGALPCQNRPFSQVDVLGLKCRKWQTLRNQKNQKLPKAIQSRLGSGVCSLLKAVTILTVKLSAQCSWTELDWFGIERLFWDGSAQLLPKQWSREETDEAAEQIHRTPLEDKNINSQARWCTGQIKERWGERWSVRREQSAAEDVCV